MSEETSTGSYRVALPEFEGPLDLLLHLCKTNEIDVVNLPISFITKKYLEYLDVMQSLSVDVAADYLVMAATLAYLKSRELVPAPEPLVAEDENGEEVLDPREELIRRLLEYRKYKDAAEQLGGRPIEGRNIFGRGMPIQAQGDGAPVPFAEHSVWKLLEAFGKLLEKAGPKITHEVMFDRVSISARINQVIDRLEVGGGSFRFDALFDSNLAEPELRSQLVVTLLAILELARLKVVRVLASEDQETLFIAQVQGAALSEARRAEVTSGDEPEPSETTEAEPEVALAAAGADHSDGAVAVEAAADDTSASEVVSPADPVFDSEGTERVVTAEAPQDGEAVTLTAADDSASLSEPAAETSVTEPEPEVGFGTESHKEPHEEA